MKKIFGKVHEDLGDSLKVLFVSHIVLGLCYPFVIYLYAQTFYSTRANGSLIHKDQNVVGSFLIAQKVDDDRFFFPRPSAVDYATIPSGASNYGPTSKNLYDRVSFAQKNSASSALPEMLTTSASGLDPHISLENALNQIPRIIQARGLSDEQHDELKQYVLDRAESRLIFGGDKNMVNVQSLNAGLDRLQKK